MKPIRLIVVFVLVVMAFGFSMQAKAGAFEYMSSINLQNLANETANITVHYYNQDGTENITPVTDTISPLGSKVYFPLPAGEGFNGSVVIESDRPLGSVSNILGNAGAAGASYVGSTAGGSPLLLPLLMKGNNGYNTWFNVQNTGNAEATINVTYSDSTTATGTVQPGASITFDQSTETHTGPKSFSAEVTANQPIAATVIEEDTQVMFAYSGFVGTSTNPVVPLVNANNVGYITGVSIQNSGSQATDVTVDYTAAPDSGTDCSETQTIPPQDSRVFALLAFAGAPGTTTDCIADAKFVGSGEVTTNSTNQPLTVIVNQLLLGVNGEAYNGFDPASATAKVVLPIIMNNNNGFWTSINLMNVGSAATLVTCTFTPFESVTLPVVSTTLQPNASYSFLQAADDEFGDTYYVGSATCVGDTGSEIIAIVNEIGPSATDDQLLVYEGFNIE